MTPEQKKLLVTRHALLKADAALWTFHAGRCGDPDRAAQLADDAEFATAEAEAIAAALALAAPDVAQPDPRSLSLVSDGVTIMTNGGTHP